MTEEQLERMKAQALSHRERGLAPDKPRGRLIGAWFLTVTAGTLVVLSLVACSPPPVASHEPQPRPRMEQGGFTYVQLRPETPVDATRIWAEVWAREPVRSGDPLYVLHYGIFVRFGDHTVP